MKKTLCSLIFAVLLCSCQMETTGQPNIDYGMSKQKVIESLSKTDQIISSDGETVVTEGLFAPIKGRARKEFIFRDGKLVSVSYKIL